MSIAASRTEEQRNRDRATNPALNAWVAANAGSGKTTLLGNRVVRLMLAGIAPERILCLTFTKAAAAQMQMRIFEQLSAWVMMDDDRLAGEIDRLRADEKSGAPDSRMLERARTLFARAMETPGGLRIQTIHAFAERILHLFPIEADVPIDFEVLSEADASDLTRMARRQIVEDAAASPSTHLGQAFGEIAETIGVESFDSLLVEAVTTLARLQQQGRLPPDDATCVSFYRSILQVPDTETREGIERAFLDSAPRAEDFQDLAAAIAEHARKGKNPNPQLAKAKAFAEIARLRMSGGEWREAYLDLVTVKDRSKAAIHIIAADVRKSDPRFEAMQEAMKNGVNHHFQRQRAFDTLVRSLALYRFSSCVLDRFRQLKNAAGVLDYDDMIIALRDLLQRGQSRWIMMKLDATIEHILVDEAQDTAPPMWDCVRLLTDEFFSGEGRVRAPRSIFVVGDEKQSIYSFQGADPQIFEATRKHFAEKLRPANLGALVEEPVALLSSFRSAPEVLKAVDQVFAAPTFRQGLSAGGGSLHHISARPERPGLVELWPILRDSPDKDEAGARQAPSQAAHVALAEKIADRIRDWLDGAAREPFQDRPISPGDILILVRTRNAFFTAMLRALKRRNIPVAGADTIVLQRELGVLDLVVVAKAALLPGDDLSLATALRTPLFGFDDAMLETLARNRTGSLWEALQASEAPHARATAERMRELVAASRHEKPFEFFAALLDRPSVADPSKSGRAAMLTRLGHDAAEPLDVFLNEALESGRDGPATVLSFVHRQAARETVIKRDLAQAENHVRVMTAHGAKGLEARVVFLGDTVDTKRGGRRPSIAVIAADNGMALPFWTGKTSQEPEAMIAQREVDKRLANEEQRRLLYVAMTRAEERLYVGGYAKPMSQAEHDRGQGIDKPDPDDPMDYSWYQLIRKGLEQAEEIDGGSAWPKPLRRMLGARHYRPDRSDAPPTATGPADERPAWLFETVAGNAQQKAGRSRPARGPDSSFDEALRRRGILLHQLFEFLPRLPAPERTGKARHLLARLAHDLSESDRADMIGEVLGILDSDHGQRLFGPHSLAEVSISGLLPGRDGSPLPVRRRIDRLVVHASGIDILDIKSGWPRAASADEAILRQLAEYRHLIAAIYPGRRITCQVLWSSVARLEIIPDFAVDAALSRITGV